MSDGPKHDLKVDPSYTFKGIKVKNLSDGYNASPVWKVNTPQGQPSQPRTKGRRPT